VLGPTLGGAIIAYELARQLDCRAVYAEQEDDKRVLRRGFTLEPGERVLLCDDILTTGRSVREIIAVAEAHEAEIVGIALLLDRSNGQTTFGYPLEALATVKANAFDPASCPMCKEGISITQRGSRKKIQ
jgi:orotate phosphoribosyltransferase